MWTLRIALASGSFSLALYGLSQVAVLAALFDEGLGWIGIGAVLLGLGLGGAAWAREGEGSAEDRAAAWMGAASVGAAVGVLAPFNVPLGSVASFLALVGLCALPAALWVWPAGVLRRERGSARTVVWSVAGAALGVVVSPLAQDFSGGPVAVGAGAATLMAGAALAISRTRASLASTWIVVSLLGYAGLVSGWTVHPFPTWSVDASLKGKQLYAQVNQDRSRIGRINTRWDSAGRTDLVGYQGQALIWSFSDGTAAEPLLIGQRDDQDREADARLFPLLALPLRAASPSRVLVAGPGAAMAAAVADAHGAGEVHAIWRSRATGVLLDTLSRAGGSGTAPLHSERGRARAILSRPGAAYDQAIVLIPAGDLFGWNGRLRAEDLYLLESLQAVWARLADGGTLAVVAGDEARLLRALFTAWELPEPEPEGRVPLGRTWGFRLAPDVSVKAPFGYLFLLEKGDGPGRGGLKARIADLASSLPVEPLFGPDVPAQGIYGLLARARDVSAARLALELVLGSQVGSQVDLAPATDLRPNFSNLLGEVHPYLAWLLALLLAFVLYAMLFPLPHLRTLDSPAAATLLPIPAYLTYFTLLGAGFGAVVFELGSRASPAVGNPGLTVAFVALGSGIGLLAGAAAVRAMGRRRGRSVWYWAFPLALALVALGNWWLTATARGQLDWSAVVSGTVLTVLWGLVYGSLVQAGLRTLPGSLAGLRPWVWRVLGAAALGGLTLALWVVQLRGWTVASGALVLSLVAAVGLGGWAFRLPAAEVAAAPAPTA